MAGDVPSDVFSAVKHRFPSPDGINIPTDAFLAAAEEVPAIIGYLGSLFTPVKYDVAGNVKKLKEKLAKDPAAFTNLFSMVEQEGYDPEGFATISLLWLKRGLEMFRGLLLALLEAHETKTEDESMVVPFRAVYAQCLEPFHGWLTRKVFNAGLVAVPYKSTLKTALRDADLKPGHPPLDDDVFFKRLKKYIDELSGCLDVVISFYDEKGLNSGKQV